MKCVSRLCMLVMAIALVIAMTLPAIAAGDTNSNMKKDDGTTPGTTPANADAAMQLALKNPPISAEFLIRVSQDQTVGKYVAAYELLPVKLGKGTITFTQKDVLIMPDEKGGITTVDYELTRLACEGSADLAELCKGAKTLLASTSQNSLWEKVRSTITERTAQLK